MTTPTPADDARRSELSRIVDAVVKIRQDIARLEAEQMTALARAGALADSLASDSDDERAACMAKASSAADTQPSDPSLRRDRFALHRNQVHAEIGAALRVSDRTVERWMDEAERLTIDFPSVMGELASGALSKQHAMAIADAGVIVTDAGRREQYARVMITQAHHDSVNRVRHTAKRVAESYAARGTETRLAEAAKRRCVTIQPLDDGMSLITAVVPAVQGAALYDRLSRMARTIVQANRRARTDLSKVSTPEASPQATPETLAASDPRTISEIRADLFADMLLTGTPSAVPCSDCFTPGPDHQRHPGEALPGAHPTASSDSAATSSLSDTALRPSNTATNATQSAGLTHHALRKIDARIQLVIPVLSLLPKKQLRKLRRIAGFKDIERLSGFTGSPHLVGHGPVSPKTARTLAGSSPGWDRVLTDPIKGTVLAVDRYEPTASLKRTLIARDLHCRFPGCRVPSAQCEIDHTVDWARGGTTVPENLAHLCVRHHTMKHHTEWRVEQLEGGVLNWLSPLGRTVLDHPTSSVMFRAVEAQHIEAENTEDPPPF